MGFFAATRPMEVVIKRTGGLVWKNWPMNHTRRANAKKRHIRLAQVESILRACSADPAAGKMQVQQQQQEEQRKEVS
ncbi:hypothetical protein R1sor_025907 [Riccia sorocarpa]|uniref:Uncharacterized protein n=1 Tax=Riccia sorocarpa TaxID=122646 RepID=A0ABD3GC00_9MARC